MAADDQDMSGHPEFREDGITEQLKALGRPVTRDNYIGLAFAGDPRGTPPTPWEAEDEMRLPGFLQQDAAAAPSMREALLADMRQNAWPHVSEQEWQRVKKNLTKELDAWGI